MKLADFEYYRTENGVLYCGDCRQILPLIDNYNLVYTDPIWPNNKLPEFSNFDPNKLFKDMYKKLYSGLIFKKRKYDRLVIHLGCDSDIRILNCIKSKFIRSIWLRYALPGHKGRILYSGDIAYSFGELPKVIKGHKLLRGEKTSSNNFGKEADHPCPRKLQHVMFLLKDYSRDNEIIIDPFAGSCTTAIASEKLSRQWICIEISEKYCGIAKQRIKAENDQLKMF